MPVELEYPGPRGLGHVLAGSWLALAGSIWLLRARSGCSGRPGWLDLPALVAPGRPDWLDLVANDCPSDAIGKKKKRFARHHTLTIGKQIWG